MSGKILLLFSFFYFVSWVSAGPHLMPTTLWKSSLFPWFSSSQKDIESIQAKTAEADLRQLKVAKDLIGTGIVLS